MSSDFQTIAALAIVAAAAAWLLVRFFKKDQPTCGHDCGCPSVTIKAKPNRLSIFHLRGLLKKEFLNRR
jgi:hypothetical protein